ncbi:FecCD family ABC transporter permease [Archangium gephyra]|uniref:FecCD family ABC transporter permease n=1 Tax=Archangium gephyra TaxID=48 RepID=UPI003B7F2E47
MSPRDLGRRSLTPARVLGLCGAFLLLLLAAVLLAATFGEWVLPLSEAFTRPGSTNSRVFWEVRLPHVLLASIVGAGLAASGSTLQGVLRNPLADPFILGVSGGAALGATLAIALGLARVDEVAPGLGGGLARISAPALFAFIGAVAAMLFVLAVSRGHGSRAPYAALLTGVIFNTFAAAAITLIKTVSGRERLEVILSWLAGNLGPEEPGTLVLSALLQAVVIGVMVALSGQLNLLTLGDEDAGSLGVTVARTRQWLLLAASASVAGAVTLSGLVGFVGLVVPHLLRLILGPDQRLLVPLSALGGAVFLVLSDLLARLLYPLFGEGIPVGVVTALLGGPLFLVLLYRSGRLTAG